MTFQIVDEKTGLIADNLSINDVDAWWKLNEDRYFGLRVDGNRIIVERLK